LISDIVFIDNLDHIFWPLPVPSQEPIGSTENKRDHTSDTADLETSTDLGGQLSLSATQDNVQEFLVGRHRRNLAVKTDQLGDPRVGAANRRTSKHAHPSTLSS
jgi:hypothetical protein